MTPDQIRREAEILVVTSGGRLSLEAALQAVEEDAALMRARECAGICTCSDDYTPPTESLWRRLMAWLLCTKP